MNKYLRYAAIALSAMLLTGCASASSNPDESSAESAAIPEEKSLVTLGDSISFGYGLEDPSTERYSALLKEKLDSRDDIVWNDYNYAVSGDKSGDLIRKLNNGRALHAPSADTIILYIGANNLLGAYSDYFMEVAAENGVDIEDFTSITDEDVEELQSKIEDEMQDPEKVMQEVQSRIDSNLVQLETDLETIYQWIRERNPEADVYVLNIYNPYTEGIESEMMPTDVDFAEYAQSQIDRANAIISDLTEKHSELIAVDIASAFAACDPIPVIGDANAEEANGDEFEMYDPHPNAEGQRIIAEAVWAEMESRT